MFRKPKRSIDQEPAGRYMIRDAEGWLFILPKRRGSLFPTLYLRRRAKAKLTDIADMMGDRM